MEPVRMINYAPYLIPFLATAAASLVGNLLQQSSGAPIDWTAWGPAGLFALFTLILLKVVFDFLSRERSAIIQNQMHIIETLNTITKTLETLQSSTNLNMKAIAEAFTAHDSRVSATMEMMAKFVSFNNPGDPQETQPLPRQSRGGKHE